MPKKYTKSKKEPWYPRLFPADRISVLQVQFFDNRDKERKKGQSEFALNVMAHTRLGGVNLRNPEWQRFVQLIDPKYMRRWAKQVYEAGDMTEEQFGMYTAALDGADEMITDESYEIVKVGHISSPPGYTYFVGQFVVVLKHNDEEHINAILSIDGENLLIDEFKNSRHRGSVAKERTPVSVALLDRSGILARQHEEEATFRQRFEAVRESVVSQRIPETRALNVEEMIEESLREMDR